MKKYTITKLDNHGRGICYVNDKITFVKNALPDEVVSISLTKESKKYQEAKVDEYHIFSNKRVNPCCKYFNNCDGCNLMHLSYEDTIKFKEDKLKQIFSKYANIDKDIKVVKSTNTINYRNKITLKVVNGEIGYYKEKSHRLCTIDRCLLVHEDINELLNDIELFDVINGEITIRINNSKELLISIKTSENIKVDITSLKKKYNIAGIVVNDKTIYGTNKFITKINNLKFYVSYNSFFQVNNEICSYLFNKLEKYINDSSRVLDLYCGVGTLGLNIANKCKQVYGVEIIPNAIEDAKKNSELNNINNTSYYCGKVENILPKLPKSIDVVIVDPPREGLDNKTKEQLLNIKADTIIYISCDPMTLARDIDALKELYKVIDIEGMDMFPYTYHVETIVILEKNNS